ncbi:type II toxin-antitoxin system RelE/ParE family toxin [Rhizobium halophytocola]|uniref:Toxin ParE1/3/4 n=1 Tax=Rhizobium halophytocola TaxID=735519 RepID=A0ABS4DT98_9HYPH|nr:type II toxin-antitoxin system RelE/ParE family toxin [Rhizobium halophytocola]MBP1848915.1 toxin ParE1/3/4 [Rhizobium halophytocola]
MARIVWSTAARDDLIAIRRYIATDHATAARVVAQHILSVAQLLASHPEMGTMTRIISVRRLVVGASPYVICYKITGDDLEILDIFDARRNLPRTAPD